jgi:hypothetical protein
VIVRMIHKINRDIYKHLMEFWEYRLTSEQNKEDNVGYERGIQ